MKLFGAEITGLDGVDLDLRGADLTPTDLS